MKIAIVEDEAVVARRLERMVREIVGAEASVDVAPSLPAARALMNQPFDLLFLDLNLNGSDGFQLLEEAAASPFQTVVVSAHHEQAIRAFDYGVADFVAKPWTFERLRIAVERATSTHAEGRRLAPPEESGDWRRRTPKARCVVVRKGRELRTIRVDDLVFIRGADDYSELHLADGSVHLHEKSLTALEWLLPATFARVHRSYIANLGRVRGMRAAALVLDDDSLVPVGRVYRGAVRERLGF
jgi:DNA-binding LytR/AlgR family response regulator